MLLRSALRRRTLGAHLPAVLLRLLEAGANPLPASLPADATTTPVHAFIEAVDEGLVTDAEAVRQVVDAMLQRTSVSVLLQCRAPSFAWKRPGRRRTPHRSLACMQRGPCVTLTPRRLPLHPQRPWLFLTFVLLCGAVRAPHAQNKCLDSVVPLVGGSRFKHHTALAAAALSQRLAPELVGAMVAAKPSLDPVMLMPLPAGGQGLCTALSLALVARDPTAVDADGTKLAYSVAKVSGSLQAAVCASATPPWWLRERASERLVDGGVVGGWLARRPWWRAGSRTCWWWRWTRGSPTRTSRRCSTLPPSTGASWWSPWCARRSCVFRVWLASSSVRLASPIVARVCDAACALLVCAAARRHRRAAGGVRGAGAHQLARRQGHAGAARARAARQVRRRGALRARLVCFVRLARVRRCDGRSAGHGLAIRSRGPARVAGSTRWTSSRPRCPSTGST